MGTPDAVSTDATRTVMRGAVPLAEADGVDRSGAIEERAEAFATAALSFEAAQSGRHETGVLIAAVRDVEVEIRAAPGQRQRR